MALSKEENDLSTCSFANTTNQPVECPFGFGRKATKSGWEQAISPLCCPLCRALLYQAQRAVPCGHCYCKVCCQRVKDCLLCAADVENYTSATEVDKDVESFIQAHSHNIDLLQEDEPGNIQTERETDFLQKRTTFLLFQALKAQNGGNYASALARLEQAQLELTGKTEQKYINQQAMILGKLSDVSCNQKELEKAVQYVEQACKLLEDSLLEKQEEFGDKEFSILSTTHGKAGDIYALLENHDLASSHFSRAIFMKEQLTSIENSASSNLQKALLLSKLAENLCSAAKKHASDAKSLVDSAGQCEASSLNDRDHNVIEYVKSTVASILLE